MKIKLSQSQWQFIGKKTGWIKCAQVEAPTKAPVKTPTPFTPTTPTQKPDKKGPFQPPRPKVMPKPKAKKININQDPTISSELKKLLKLSKTYEEGVLEPVRNFWLNIPKDHPFSQNPILSEYGHNLSQEGYKYISDKMTEKKQNIPINAPQALKEAQQLITKIFQLEKSHEEKLIEEAKNITAQIWGIDKSQLQGELGQNPEDGGGEEEKPETVDITPPLRSEINKRIIFNTLTHGSAVHAMYSVHHLITDKLNSISPELVELYTRLSGIITHHYYILDIPAIVRAMQDLKGAAIGWSHVEFKDEKANVVAQGICFPVLVQEMFKGVMELLSLHGINQNLSEQELHTIYQHSDRLEDEPWLLTVGPALWRKFLDVIPKDISLSEVVMKLSKEEAIKVEKIIRSIIQNPNAAKEYFKNKNMPQESNEEPNEIPSNEDSI